MVKPVVFLFHGMGVHDAGWERTILDCINTVAQRYAFFKGDGNSPEDKIDFVPVGYDHVLREQVANWDKAAEDLRKLPGAPDELVELMDWIESSDEGMKKYIWTHAMDVVLYRFHSPTRKTIMNHAIDTMAKKIDAIIDIAPSTFVSIMAHSLGTAVAHDSIHFLGNREWGGQYNGFSPNIWQFTCITMLANVSRLLETDIAQKDSIVRPGRLGELDSYCSKYQNFRHEYDPIPWPRQIVLDDFPKYRTVGCPIRHLHDPNVHSWEHYMLNPRVHIPFLRSVLVNRDAITPDEENAAIDPQNFPQWGGKFSKITQRITEFREDFESVKDMLGDSPSIKDIVQATVQITKFIDKWHAIIVEMGGGDE